MKIAAIAERAQLIRRPHELFGPSDGAGVAPWPTRHGVIVQADIVPADDDSQLDGDRGVRITERLFLKEVVAGVDLLNRVVGVPTAILNCTTVGVSALTVMGTGFGNGSGTDRLCAAPESELIRRRQGCRRGRTSPTGSRRRRCFD